MDCRTRTRCEWHVFSVPYTSVAAAILAAVEGGILPPGPEVRNGSDFSNHTPIPPGRMPGSTAGKMPAATLNTYPSGGREPSRPRGYPGSLLGVLRGGFIEIMTQMSVSETFSSSWI